MKITIKTSEDKELYCEKVNFNHKLLAIRKVVSGFVSKSKEDIESNKIIITIEK